MIALIVLLAFVVFLGARLRAASAWIAELRAQRDTDVETIAHWKAENAELAASVDEVGKTQAALQDAQTALLTLRVERDQGRRLADEAHRQRHAFLAGLAHDLRNPLAPLSNGIELLRLTDNDAAGRLRTRGIMERQVGNLLRIADDLSDLARLSGDRPPLHQAPFELAELLRTMDDDARTVLQSQDMKLVVAPLPTQMPTLEGDAQRLSQALRNLVVDLVRNSERGSTVAVVAVVGDGFVDIGVASVPPDGDGIDLAPGVTPTAQGFENVDASTLGLGIALSSQVAALHGGRLAARRSVGTRRASYVMTLPLPAATAAGSTQPLAAAAHPVVEASLSVLLADDNIDFSHSFGTMLELLGHHVEVVHDGLAAVASIVGSPPDIAFVDVGMPSLDGVEAVRRVRGQGNTQNVVLVAVTGRGGAEDRERAAEAGFDRYLVKPFAMQDVRDALDAAHAIRGA